eukprot:6455603-Amphidinium_carterae.1
MAQIGQNFKKWAFGTFYPIFVSSLTHSFFGRLIAAAGSLNTSSELVLEGTLLVLANPLNYFHPQLLASKIRRRGFEGN